MKMNKVQFPYLLTIRALSGRPLGGKGIDCKCGKRDCLEPIVKEFVADVLGSGNVRSCSFSLVKHGNVVMFGIAEHDGESLIHWQCDME